MNKRKILLIDDDTIMLHVIENYLSKEYEVISTSSSKSVYDILCVELPDLILLDYEMPLFDGASILSMIRKRKKTKYLPVVFLSGKIDSFAMAKIMENKPQGFITKPVTKEELLEYLKNFFDENDKKMFRNMEDRYWEN